jgi:hypothetical protein
MPERDIRKALKARVESYGGEIRAVAWLGRRNAPDVLCLFPHASPAAFLHRPKDYSGFNVWVEAKAPGGKATLAQVREHHRMFAAACTVLVISTLDQLDEWLPPLTPLPLD